MSIGSLGGIAGSAAGAPLSQTKGSEAERAKQDAAAQERTDRAEQKADDASGIGQTEQDEQASERDADGRRLWEKPPEPSEEADADDDDTSAEAPPAERQSLDPTGQAGKNLDLTG